MKKASLLSMAYAMAALGASSMYGDGPSGPPIWRFERKEKPMKPKYSLEPNQPKGTKIHESEYKEFKIKFYYGTEKARQKRLIKIHHEIDNYLNSLR